MIGDLILADFKSKTWVSDRARQDLESRGKKIILEALSGEPGMCGMEPVIHISIPYGGQGIDGMFTDTSCSEINPDKPA